MKDIFLDTNLSHYLDNPATPEYRQFLEWLFKDGALVMTKKLLAEYDRGNKNLVVIIGKLTIDGRLNMISNIQLKKCFIPKRIESRFLSNQADRVHIKSVILSNRKMAIVGDKNLMSDINSCPRIRGKKPIAANNPSNIEYK